METERQAQNRTGEEAMIRATGAAGMPALCCGTLILLALASPAQAGNLTHNVPQLSPSLRYEVAGQVSANCHLQQPTHGVEITGVADRDTDLAQAATARLPFTINCNTPMRVEMTSLHGALQYSGTASSDAHFTAQIDYSASLNLPGRDAVLTCESAQMREVAPNCSGIVSDGGVVNGEGSIRVDTRAGSGLLQAGTYSDTLRVTVTPILGSGGT